MGVFKDLTGQTFERLTVIKRVENSKNGHAQFLCLCQCGTTVVVQGHLLISRHSKSCGCYQRDSLSKRNKKCWGAATFNNVLCGYKARSKKEGREFSLSIDEFKELTASPCFYCGRKLANKEVSEYDNGDFEYNGIDRIDSTKGYIKGNVVPSCGRCNTGKNNYSKDEFVSCIKAIYAHLDLDNNFSSNYKLNRD